MQKSPISWLQVASHEISFTGCSDAIMWPSFYVYFAPADIEFDSESGGYYPILYLNDYWNLAQDYMPINDTTKSVSLVSRPAVLV